MSGPSLGPSLPAAPSGTSAGPSAAIAGRPARAARGPRPAVLGAALVLIGAIIGTFLVTGVMVPTKGEPIGALLEWVQGVYGAAGLGAVVFGAVLGLYLGGQQRQGG
jgi:hypothetical protein